MLEDPERSRDYWCNIEVPARIEGGTIRQGMLTLSTTAALVEFLSNFNLQVSLV